MPLRLKGVVGRAMAQRQQQAAAIPSASGVSNSSPTRPSSVESVIHRDMKAGSLPRSKSPSFASIVSKVSAAHGKSSSIAKRPRQSLFAGKPEDPVDASHRKTCRRCGVLSPDSRLSTTWELIVVLPLLYTATVMPFQVFFLVDDDSPEWAVVDVIVSLFFLIDMIVAFNLGYYDRNDDIVLDRCKIASRYLRSWFILDLVSLVPLDIFVDGVGSGNKLARLTRLPRVVKMLRLLRLVKFAAASSIRKVVDKLRDILVLSPSVMRMLKTFFICLLVTHILAGFWHYIAYEDPQGWLVQTGLQNEDVWYLYSVSVYWVFVTLSSVGYGDIHPFTTKEFWFSNMVVLIGLIGSGVVVADILNIVSSLDDEASAQKQRTDSVNRLIRLAKPPKMLRRNLLRWVDTRKRKEENSYDPRALLKEMPKDLQMQVKFLLTKDIVLATPFLHDKDLEVRIDVAWRFKPLQVAPDTFLGMESTPVKEMFFVKSGKVEVLQGGEPVFVCEDRNFFWEWECLLSNTYRTSAISQTACELYSLSKEDVQDLVRKHVIIGQELRQVSLYRMRNFGIASEGLEEDASHGAQRQASRRMSAAATPRKRRPSAAVSMARHASTKSAKPLVDPAWLSSAEQSKSAPPEMSPKDLLRLSTAIPLPEEEGEEEIDDAEGDTHRLALPRKGRKPQVDTPPIDGAEEDEGNSLNPRLSLAGVVPSFADLVDDEDTEGSNNPNYKLEEVGPRDDDPFISNPMLGVVGAPHSQPEPSGIRPAWGPYGRSSSLPPVMESEEPSSQEERKSADREVETLAFNSTPLDSKTIQAEQGSRPISPGLHTEDSLQTGNNGQADNVVQQKLERLESEMQGIRHLLTVLSKKL